MDETGRMLYNLVICQPDEQASKSFRDQPQIAHKYYFNRIPLTNRKGMIPSCCNGLSVRRKGKKKK